MQAKCTARGKAREGGAMPVGSNNGEGPLWLEQSKGY